MNTVMQLKIQAFSASLQGYLTRKIRLVSLFTLLILNILKTSDQVSLKLKAICICATQIEEKILGVSYRFIKDQEQNFYLGKSSEWWPQRWGKMKAAHSITSQPTKPRTKLAGASIRISSQKSRPSRLSEEQEEPQTSFRDTVHWRRQSRWAWRRDA